MVFNQNCENYFILICGDRIYFMLVPGPEFCSILVEGFAWLKKTAIQPFRGFTNDSNDVPEASRRIAAQKVSHLDLMLGQIDNYCLIISRNTVQSSQSVASIWQFIRRQVFLFPFYRRTLS